MLQPVLRRLVFWGLAVAWGSTAFAQIELPTPASHYEDYDPEKAAQTLMLQLAVRVPEARRARAMELFERAKAGDPHVLTVAEARELLESADWTDFRPDLLRLLLYGSNVLGVVPTDYAHWTPLVHDALLLFLDQLSEERLIERVVAQANLPRDASRGARALAFIVNTPSLQKLAQILARNQGIDADFRAALQTVENGLDTAQYDAVFAQIESELSASVWKQYELELDDTLLGEASVGAVVAAMFKDPETGETERAACKVLKPYAVSALAEDLVIIDHVLLFLEENAEFYDLGATPLVEIFLEIRQALSREVRVKDEQQNLSRAHAYYADQPKVLVPALYPYSTKNLTCMELVRGVKITDAYIGDGEKRAKLARRLSDALMYDVLFSPHDTALFHGDPHAGNVFHVEEGGEDPFRIALIDWGLAAEFNRREREKMVQLMLGLSLRHAKRLANNVDVLIEWEPEGPEDIAAMKARMKELLAEESAEGMFALLDKLIARLAREGYSLRFDATMFIKSQLTISGILAELDPEFEQDEYVMGRMASQVTSELGKRLLRTVYFPKWNSHDYPSMMSNEDVKDVQCQKIGRGFKAFGKAIWKGVTFQWLF